MKTACSKLCLLLVFWAAVCGVRRCPASTPNFLLFLSDDLSWHDLGCTGNSDVRTPHLDGFARQGTLFPRAYNSSPMCAPTRMSLYTGLHPVRNGGYPNHSRVYDGVRSLPQILGKMGYRVAILGKRHEKPESSFPFEFLGGRHHDDGTGLDLDVDKVSDFLATSRDRPWCLVVASNQPHTPWNRGDSSAYDPDRLALPPYFVDTPETRSALAQYYAEITYMDAQFGTVMRYLEASGEAKETLVLFFSEQGSNFPYCKWTCYETGLRSAVIARWPGRVPAGRVCSQMIQYVDTLPTLLELAGGDPASFDFDGVSISRLLFGGDEPVHRYIFGLQTSRGIGRGPKAYGIRTVCDERYRLIWNLNWEDRFQNSVTYNFAPYLSWKTAGEAGNAFAASRYKGYQQRPEFELYDLEADPWEMHNLADDPAQRDRLAAMRRALEGWMKQQGDAGVATELAAFSRMPGKSGARKE